MQSQSSEVGTRGANPLNVPWTIEIGDGPVVAAAIHAGHEVRTDVAEWLALDEADRLREEDPLTGIWTTIADSAIRVYRSRFEVDLNRPREKAVSFDPRDTWGMTVWRDRPPEHVIRTSLEEYDRFYDDVEDLFDRLVAQWNSVLVLDLHSYNHRRAGPDRPGDSVVSTPEINVGTGTLDRDYWSSLIDRFIEALRGQRFRHRELDVRENVKFKGGYFAQWLHAKYPKKVCVLAVELKKIFMDEWVGTANILALEELRVALRDTANSVREELTRLR